MDNFDIWVDSKEDKIFTKLRKCDSRLVELETYMYIQEKILSDLEFIKKYKIDKYQHELKLRELQEERITLKKVIRKLQRELADLRAKAHTDENIEFIES